MQTHFRSSASADRHPRNLILKQSRALERFTVAEECEIRHCGVQLEYNEAGVRQHLGSL